MDPKAYPEWQSKLLKQLVSTTRAASVLASHDLSFESSIDSAFNTSLNALTNRLLSTTNSLLKFAGHEGENFSDEEDLQDRWGEAVDVVDSLLERAVLPSKATVNLGYLCR
jgi:exosome complex exonuclease RRP6